MTERIAQHGGTALGITEAATAKTVLAKTVLEPYPTNIFKFADKLAAVILR